MGTNTTEGIIMELLDKEHYINIIELLKQSLEFYANSSNYNGVPEKDFKGFSESLIIKDRGEQARFALKSVASILKQTQEMGDNLDELLKNVGSGDAEAENTMEELLKKMQNLKDDGNQI